MSEPYAYEPYTDEEQREDTRSWALSTPKQRLAAFDELLCAATAVAVNRQNELLIETMRQIRANRDKS